MTELHVCEQLDILSVLSVLCPWAKIYIEHAQILCHVPEELLKQKVVMVRAQTPIVLGVKGKSASAASVLPNVQLVHVNDGFAQVHSFF